MRAPLYLACWAAVAVAARTNSAAVSSEEISPFNQPPLTRQLIEPVEVAADRETVSYLLPRLAAKYRPSQDWSDVTDPRFYVLTEMDNDDSAAPAYDEPNKIRNKRYMGLPRNLKRYVGGMDGSPKLSIIAPIDSLRKLYRQVQQQKQAERNRAILENLPNFQ